MTLSLHLQPVVLSGGPGSRLWPALTIAELVAMKNDADPVLLVMPADHVIQDTAAFQAVVAQGAALAAKGTFVTFGMPGRLHGLSGDRAHGRNIPGRVPMEVIEVQSGSYLGEDDIVQFEDKYGR